MKNYRRIMTGFLAAAMVFAAMPSAHAASSSEIKGQINSLRAEKNAIDEQIAALKEQENANWDSTEEMVEQKDNIDQQMFLLYAQLDNLEDQITEYGQLIAQNQQELDQAQSRLANLNEKNKERIRAMEEDGKLSYWSVVFKANNFTDLIDRLSMVKEIAEADEKMLASLDEAAKEVARVQDELVSQKTELEKSREEQLAAQKELETKRGEADEILTKLNSERKDLEADHKAVEDEKNALMAEIAQAEKEYNEAKAREEEERRRQEEEERRRQEEEAAKNPGNNSKPEEKPEQKPEEKPSTPPSAAGESWMQPCSYVYISSPYGPRGSGFHNGVDFAAHRGTPIYASRSGTVTKVRSMTTSYGNHVVINHGDGYSSLYAHMDYYVVSQGQYVTRGQLIGYVGSTGNSTGPHLHFTVLHNGSSVNPMQFL